MSGGTNARMFRIRQKTVSCVAWLTCIAFARMSRVVSVLRQAHEVSRLCPASGSAPTIGGQRGLVCPPGTVRHLSGPPVGASFFVFSVRAFKVHCPALMFPAAMCPAWGSLPMSGIGLLAHEQGCPFRKHSDRVQPCVSAAKQLNGPTINNGHGR
jgi:hypothetical protein